MNETKLETIKHLGLEEGHYYIRGLYTNIGKHVYRIRFAALLLFLYYALLDQNNCIMISELKNLHKLYQNSDFT